MRKSPPAAFSKAPWPRDACLDRRDGGLHSSRGVAYVLVQQNRGRRAPLAVLLGTKTGEERGQLKRQPHITADGADRSWRPWCRLT